MKNQLIQFPQGILKQIKCLRKISASDKFPCFSCFDDKYLRINCKVCGGCGFVYGSHPMVQFSEDFIEKKIGYLKKQEQKKSNSLSSEEHSREMQFSSNRKSTHSSHRQINNFSQMERSNIKNSSINIECDEQHPSVYQQNSSLTKSKILSEASSDEEDQTIVHQGYCCDQCKKDPITGYRYHCETCQDYDLCPKCYRKGLHDHDFNIFKQSEPSMRTSTMPKNDLYKNIRKSIRKID